VQKSCRLEKDSASGTAIFSVLALKELGVFIDFTSSSPYAFELRKLYNSNSTESSILLELTSTVNAVSLNFNSLFAIKIEGGANFFYPNFSTLDL